MLQINYDMDMPKTCSECPLIDEEFYYCHGRKEYSVWEVQDIYRHDLDRPSWCPLIEVNNNAT